MLQREYPALKKRYYGEKKDIMDKVKIENPK
jgi:hypothetical protein